MRKPQNPRRARGRNPGGRQQGNGRQRRPNQNSANRVYDSQGPDGRVKGTPAQLHERYSNASREVRGSDRILAESFLQFADHYYRLAAEFQENQAESRAQPRQASDEQPQFENGGEDRSVTVDGSAGSEQSQPRTDNDSRQAAQSDRSQPERSSSQRADSGRSESGRSGPDRSDSRVTEDDIPMLRRRGRPRRASADEEGTEQPSLINLEEPASGSRSEAAEAGDEEEKLAPRRRGRPAKSEVAETADGEDKPAPRRRGRPRKVDVAEEGAPAAASAATTAETEEKPAPRRRGRPRKSEAVAEAEPETAS